LSISTQRFQLGQEALATKAPERARQTGRQLVQAPAEACLHARAFTNKVFAIIVEQLELPCRAIEVSYGKIPLAQRYPDDGKGIDRVGLGSLATTSVLCGWELGVACGTSSRDVRLPDIGREVLIARCDLRERWHKVEQCGNWSHGSRVVPSSPPNPTRTTGPVKVCAARDGASCAEQPRM
jgi:hypothetical protein